MSDYDLTDCRMITADKVRNAINIVVWDAGPHTCETPEPPCEFTRLCDPEFCRFPRYQRNGAAAGLVGRTLVQLGYPVKLLLDLDREYEMGEVVHPGVKIATSRNAALARIDSKGRALLAWMQEHQKSGLTWGTLSAQAFGKTWRPQLLDRRRRPWLY